MNQLTKGWCVYLENLSFFLLQVPCWLTSKAIWRRLRREWWIDKYFSPDRWFIIGVQVFDTCTCPAGLVDAFFSYTAIIQDLIDGDVKTDVWFPNWSRRAGRCIFELFWISPLKYCWMAFRNESSIIWTQRHPSPSYRYRRNETNIRYQSRH